MYRSTLPDVKGKNYEALGVVRTFLAACNYDGEVCDMLDAGMNSLEQQAADWGADGVIGITIVSASTYMTDYYDNTYPDAIMYGTAINFID